MAQRVKNVLAMQETQEAWVPPLGWEDPLEEGMAIHPIFLPGGILRIEEPGGLPSMESHRLGHD